MIDYLIKESNFSVERAQSMINYGDMLCACQYTKNKEIVIEFLLFKMKFKKEIVFFDNYSHIIL